MLQTWGTVARTNIANKEKNKKKNKMEKAEGMKDASLLKVPNYTDTILICVSTLCGGEEKKKNSLQDGDGSSFHKVCADTHFC